MNVSWLPLFHDFGLIGNVLHAIYSGGHTLLMAPEDFARRPLRWLKAISKYKAKTSRFPNFALGLSLKRITAEDRDALDLSSWTVAANGAEPIRASSLREFADYFADAGFEMTNHAPVYGLAEFTLYATFVLPTSAPRVLSVSAEALGRNIVELEAEGAEGALELVGCGNAHGDTRVIIVDPRTLAQKAPGEVGEIWLQGGSAAQGYWNRPDESERVFGATIPDREEEGRFLRTGDLGFVHDGELFFSGRVKDIIIIEGMNHYPQDIEATIEAAAECIRPGCAAAFSVDRAGGEQVVVVAECSADSTAAQRKADKARILQAVSMKNDIGIRDIAFIKPKSIPKTTSGKLQRFECRDKYESKTLDLLEEV